MEQEKVFFKSGEKDGFDVVGAQYLRQYIHQGHELAGEALTNIQIEALDAFDQELEHPDNVLVSDYRKGRFYIFNNYCALHGRTAFEDHPDNRKRELFRVWIKPS